MTEDGGGGMQMEIANRKSQIANPPNPYQRILQKTYDLQIPLTAHIELTHRCNLRCVHCYATNNKAIRNELTAAEVDSALEQLAEMGCLFLTMTGGEVFCRNDIFPIFVSARANNFALHVFTNGTLITPEVADKLAAIEPLSVEISLYALKPDIHDSITATPGSHDRAMRAITLCLERGINTVIKSPLMKHNMSEYRALREFAENAGTRVVFDLLLVPTDDGRRTMPQHGLTEDEMCAFMRANAQRKTGAAAKPEMSDPLCGAGSNALCINPVGDVFPCLAIREAVGNMRETALREIWRSISLETIRGATFSSLGKCRSCEFAAYCSRCAGVALAECGDMFAAPESICALARASKRAMD